MTPTIIPFLCAKSVEDSVEFYTKKLGFKLDEATHMPGEYAHVYLGELSDTTAQIMLHSPAPPGSPNCKTSYGPSELLIRLSGDAKGKEIVDEWHDKIVKNGVEAKEKPEDKPWNCRQAVFTDPDGHELQFYFWLGTASN